VIRDFQVASWNRIIRPVAARWSDAELEELLARIPTRQRREDWRRMARNPFRADEVAAALEGVREMIARMETALAASPWLAGDSFSLADIGVTPYVVRLDEFAPHGVSLRDAPAVADWWARVQARPGFVAARIGPIAQPGAPERAA
jgi:glutathione S-transferase